MPSFDTKYALETLNILVLDDNRHMRHPIREILLALGIRKTNLVGNVPQAFKELRHFDADIIITDWHLEPLDGFEFVKLVRTAKDSRNPYVPIIMFPAYTEYQHVQNARDVGINELLAKPVSVKALYDRIVAIIDTPPKFVRSKHYFGPDRRRQDLGRPGNMPERRSVALELNSAGASSL